MLKVNQDVTLDTKLNPTDYSQHTVMYATVPDESLVHKQPF